jgi:ribosomal protein S18 acetylase RimI-like enzyme
MFAVKLAVSISPARVEDADAIAALQIESWRSAYRGFLPDAFLDGPIVEDRLRLWRARLPAPAPERRLVLEAITNGALAGFVCVLLDAEPQWGALLDNLHVRPDLKGLGIGKQLFERARNWVGTVAPTARMHLTVIEENVAARRFYDRQGGTIVERKVVEVVRGTRLPVVRYSWEPKPPVTAP